MPCVPHPTTPLCPHPPQVGGSTCLVSSKMVAGLAEGAMAEARTLADKVKDRRGGPWAGGCSREADLTGKWTLQSTIVRTLC